MRGGVGIVGACAMTTNLLDNRICYFQNSIVMASQAKQRFWTISLSAPTPPGPPQKKGKYYLLCLLLGREEEARTRTKTARSMRLERSYVGKKVPRLQNLLSIDSKNIISASVSVYLHLPFSLSNLEKLQIVTFLWILGWRVRIGISNDIKSQKVWIGIGKFTRNEFEQKYR